MNLLVFLFELSRCKLKSPNIYKMSCSEIMHSVRRYDVVHLSYWEIILMLSDDHPVKNAYNMLRRLHNLAFKNWCSHSKKMHSELIAAKERQH